MSDHTILRRRFVQSVGLGGLAMAGTGLASAQEGPTNFRAHLAGENEVPAVETNARGEAVFQLDGSGTALQYKLIVANIEDVLMAHIHQALPGENGDIVVWLYPDGPPPQLIEGRFDGVLAEGTITADDLVRDLEGEDMDVLVSAIEAGKTYVNVHTAEHGGGEIRGQIH